MKIIKINPSDVNDLLALSRKTFHEAFSHLNKSENMDVYMNKAYTVNQLFSELLNPFSEFYFVVMDEEKAGFIKVNKCPAQSDIRDDQSLEIERIYIDSKFQGSGLGSILLQFAKDRAKTLDLEYVWLGVWEKNIDAIRFYERHGFVIFSSHPFVFGDEVQTDLLMKYFLEKNI